MEQFNPDGSPDLRFGSDGIKLYAVRDVFGAVFNANLRCGLVEVVRNAGQIIAIQYARMPNHLAGKLG